MWSGTANFSPARAAFASSDFAPTISFLSPYWLAMLSQWQRNSSATFTTSWPALIDAAIPDVRTFLTAAAPSSFTMCRMIRAGLGLIAQSFSWISPRRRKSPSVALATRLSRAGVARAAVSLTATLAVSLLTLLARTEWKGCPGSLSRVCLGVSSIQGGGAGAAAVAAASDTAHTLLAAVSPLPVSGAEPRSEVNAVVGAKEVATESGQYLCQRWSCWRWWRWQRLQLRKRRWPTWRWPASFSSPSFVVTKGELLLKMCGSHVKVVQDRSHMSSCSFSVRPPAFDTDQRSEWSSNLRRCPRARTS